MRIGGASLAEPLFYVPLKLKITGGCVRMCGSSKVVTDVYRWRFRDNDQICRLAEGRVGVEDRSKRECHAGFRLEIYGIILSTLVAAAEDESVVGLGKEACSYQLRVEALCRNC